MSEFRQDIISKKWILFAPSREERSGDFKIPPATPDPKNLPKQEQSCFFCENNEFLNQEIASYPKGKGWKVRVIPNKYKALDHLQSTETDPGSSFYPSQTGVGDHEVIITRVHNVMPHNLPDDVMDLVLRVYQERMSELSEHPNVSYVQIFGNYGRDAGASLLHPHSQIISMPFVPDHVHEEVSNSFSFYQEHGACFYCETIVKEFENKKRLVLDHRDFMVFTPYASAFPYEFKIISKTHRANFKDISTTERHSLVLVLKYILQQLHAKLGNPAYNFYIHTMPVSNKPNTKYNQRSYHWHMVITPRLEVLGGFEIASGVYVNSVLPETAAEIFRKTS